MTGSDAQAPASGTVVSVEPLLDIQLQLLIRLLEAEPQSSLPITLHVPGGLVHGDLITQQAWKADWAQSVRRLGGKGAQLLAEFPETVDQSLDEVIGEQAPEHLPRWIHLRDATLAGAEGPFTVPAWRGRLADVSGWSLTRPE
ncbi:hypothetical protein ACFO9E_26350 [Streptomyces maoxianensis]|uniref:Uncharacterized protein n=1 Tax=Streptomyces maoxianensis TaxID=1459942 RepID=A0ABV9GFC5_9ACTN